MLTGTPDRNLPFLLYEPLVQSRIRRLVRLICLLSAYAPAETPVLQDLSAHSSFPNYLICIPQLTMRGDRQESSQ